MTQGPVNAATDVPVWISKLAMPEFQNLLSMTAYNTAQDASIGLPVVLYETN